jgi:ribonucleotide reductase beta subunit family protein with ferritin-like domain
MTVRMQTLKTTFTVDYPEAIEFMNSQQAVYWPHFEVKVYKDKQDILVNLTPQEKHGVITTLRIFTKYEQIIGSEFWINFVMKKFPRPADIQPMAATFGAVELGIHQFFYKALNEELGIATDEFYEEYTKDPELKARIDYLTDTLENKDDLRALGGFTFGEGAILYSSFAFLKHFQMQGKNKLVNTVSGINFSARDEHLHSVAAAWLFRTLLHEKREAGEITPEQEQSLKEDIVEAAKVVLEHEQVIIAKIFEKGKIDGITPHQLEVFAKSRIDLCLANLGYEPIYNVEYNPIGDWFYKGISGYSSQDFFSSKGNQYSRDWDLNGFGWVVKK